MIGAVLVTLGFLYFYKPANNDGTAGSATNFISQLFPFGKSKTVTTPGGETPVDVSGFVPTPVEEIPKTKITKVSTMPIAGYGVFMKERFKDVPVVANPTPTLPLSGEGDIISPPDKGGKGGLIAKGDLGGQKDKKGKVIPQKPTAPPTEFVPALRYVDRTTGNIYQTYADKIEERKFSGTIIPKVYEAYFGDKDESVVMRYLKEDDKTIETFVGALAKEFLGADSDGSTDVKGSFLPENITDMSMSPDGKRMFYLFNVGNGTTGITAEASGGQKNQVFDSPFTEWLSFWPSNKMITLTTKPSANVPGFMYAIDPDKKDFNRILGGINGLTTLTSPDGKLVLFGNNNLSLNIYNIATGNINQVSVKTLPEKCVWGRASDKVYCAVPKSIDGASYPDDWYQGEVSFGDEIWRIDAINGNADILGDPSSMVGGEEVDGIKLSLDENEDYLFFVNKKDSYLWKLNLR